LVIFY